ncbi:MAG: alpha-hydroxy-acid oxidizing protein, partial [Butyrivibrio sp.]|nr:alpha-hydroxy-acid oxidizing protein [Butyrivibrio sp.]
MNAAFSHLEKAHPGYPQAMAEGFKGAGALNMWGMSTDEEMEKIYATGADTIEIIKPYDEEKEIFHRIEFALSHGAVPPLQILPEIREVVGDKLEIYADCGFDTALDVFKALAIGAKAVSVSRAILDKTYDTGAEGVTKEINSMTAELVSIMGRCGFATTDSINDSVLWSR